MRSSPWLAPLVVLAVALLAIGGWFVVQQLLDANPRTGASQTASSQGQRPSASGGATVSQSAAPAVHHGNSPDCPDTDCIAMLVNGDLLFHEGLWKNFANNPQATDGSAFDFTPLFAPMSRYIKASDIAVCQFETPIAQRGGPYAAYPVFNIPPEAVDAVASVGYSACTHASNHSWDQGAAGIARLTAALQANGIAQTGSYLTEQDSTKPLVVASPTGGGSLGIVAGTLSLNGEVPDHDWRVDRLRESGDPHHQSDIDRAVAKAKAARAAGADIVAIAMHSVQEYLDYADSWQQSEAHELADTGAFDLIYGAGCHCAQPIEHYHGTWIIYGLGNAVTVTTHIPGHSVNNQGVTARIQFAGKKGVAGSWRVSRIDWVPTANVRQGKYRWCPIASDHPDGVCWDAQEDARVRQRISDVIYSKNADRTIVREWLITKETKQ
ncbi:MAG: CapA family protein [Bifidobacterium sp.]|jgi:poly-gamma-glutamate synthesis protein (capsule biosynthesis protein)|nr:CapA family protein [Bifidobacterium sp.]MCH4208741.1 CapA family protein [Bifidobacterium sp.]MCI1224001.1 CapA family protein [Bifidobacterium sp.]